MRKEKEEDGRRKKKQWDIMARNPSHRSQLMISNKHARIRTLGKQIEKDKELVFEGTFCSHRDMKNPQVGG
jgi:hypothetical protein